MEDLFGFYATPLWLAQNDTRLVCMYRIRALGEPEAYRLVDIPEEEQLIIGDLIS
jgi:hypothetical protein